MFEVYDFVAVDMGTPGNHSTHTGPRVCLCPSATSPDPQAWTDLIPISVD